MPRIHHNSIKYTGAENWNSLRVKTQKAQSLQVFKRLDLLQISMQFLYITYNGMFYKCLLLFNTH